MIMGTRTISWCVGIFVLVHLLCWGTSTSSDLFRAATSVLDASWNPTFSFTEIDNVTGPFAQSSTVSLLVATANVLRYFSTKGNGEKSDLALFDRAYAELRAVMQSQWTDTGMMPHLIYPYGENNTDGNFTDRVYIPSASFWGVERRSKSGFATSGLAALPLHGTVVWRLYNAAPNNTMREEIGKMAQGVEDWHTYLWEHRRDENVTSSDGLLFLLHPWEGILPFLTAWNATSPIDACESANYSYPATVSEDPRYGDKMSYDSELCRIQCLARDAYRGTNTTRCGFAISSFVFSSVFLRSNKDLVKLKLAEGMGTSDDLSRLDSMSLSIQNALERASKSSYVYDRSTGRNTFDVGLTRYATVFADGPSYVPGTKISKILNPTAYTSYMDAELLFPLYASIWSQPSLLDDSMACVRYSTPLSLLRRSEPVASVYPMFTWMVASGFFSGANASLYSDFLQNQTLEALTGVLRSDTVFEPFLPYGVRADNGSALMSNANDTSTAATVVLLTLPSAPETVGYIKSPFGSIGTIIFVFVLLAVILGVGCIFFGTTLRFLHVAAFDVANDKSPSGMLQRPLIPSNVDTVDLTDSPRSAVGRRMRRASTRDMTDRISTPTVSRGFFVLPQAISSDLVAGTKSEEGVADSDGGWYSYFTKHLRV